MFLDLQQSSDCMKCCYHMFLSRKHQPTLQSEHLSPPIWIKLPNLCSED